MMMNRLAVLCVACFITVMGGYAQATPPGSSAGVYADLHEPKSEHFAKSAAPVSKPQISKAVLRFVPGLEEPLVATARTTAREDAALDAAIAAFKAPATGHAADFAATAAPLIAYLDAHPSSAWRTALLTNLGI